MTAVSKVKENLTVFLQNLSASEAIVFTRRIIYHLEFSLQKISTCKPTKPTSVTILHCLSSVLKIQNLHSLFSSKSLHLNYFSGLHVSYKIFFDGFICSKGTTSPRLTNNKKNSTQVFRIQVNQVSTGTEQCQIHIVTIKK